MLAVAWWLGISFFFLSGGAPELCPQFRHLVEGSVKLGKIVIDRCNLTALLEPGQEDTAQFLANHGVHVIASLPCYSAKNVNLQRGSGVFQRSITALHMLNDLGYGQEGSKLQLDLVYNPLGKHFSIGAYFFVSLNAFIRIEVCHKTCS